jgi:hypothetical protein
LEPVSTKKTPVLRVVPSAPLGDGPFTFEQISVLVEPRGTVIAYAISDEAGDATTIYRCLFLFMVKQ